MRLKCVLVSDLIDNSVSRPSAKTGDPLPFKNQTAIIQNATGATVALCAMKIAIGSIQVNHAHYCIQSTEN